MSAYRDPAPASPEEPKPGGLPFIAFRDGFNKLLLCVRCQRTRCVMGRFRDGAHGFWLWRCRETRPHFHIACEFCQAEFLMGAAEVKP